MTISLHMFRASQDTSGSLDWVVDFIPWRPGCSLWKETFCLLWVTERMNRDPRDTPLTLFFHSASCPCHIGSISISGREKLISQAFMYILTSLRMDTLLAFLLFHLFLYLGPVSFCSPPNDEDILSHTPRICIWNAPSVHLSRQRRRAYR